MKKFTKLTLTLAMLFGIVGGVKAQSKTTLADLKAANGTDAAWLAVVPASYPLGVKDDVLFGSDADSQTTNADVNKYDYIYFEVTNFSSERAVRVFFWDPTGDKRINYFLKPVADKETANYSESSTVTKNGTYCVQIPAGARLQGAKTPWTSSPASDPYFEFSEIYLTERAETYIEATEILEAPVSTTNLNKLTGTNTSWSSSVVYPTEFAVQGSYWGCQGGTEETHVNIDGYDYVCVYIPSASNESVSLRLWIWDGEAGGSGTVKTLYFYPISDYATADFTVGHRISAGGTYVCKVTGYKYLKGFKADNNWGAPSVTVCMAWAGSGTPISYVPTGKYSLIGDVSGSPSLTAALSNPNATYYDASNVSGTSVDLSGVSNPNALFVAKSGVLSNTKNVIVSDVCANLELTDGKPFKAPAAFTATAAPTYSRAFTAGNTTTVCLPFALTSAEAATLGTFYELNSFDGSNTLHFTSVAAPEANKAYLVVPTSTGLTLSETGKSIAATPADLGTNVSGVDFIGTLAATEIPASDASYSYYAYNNGSLVKIVTNAATLPAFRGYFKVNVSGGAPVMNIVFDSETTGIKAIENGQLTIDNAVYNLAGQRVAQPTRGLYIVNGKKVVIK